MTKKLLDPVLRRRLIQATLAAILSYSYKYRIFHGNRVDQIELKLSFLEQALNLKTWHHELIIHNSRPQWLYGKCRTKGNHAIK